MSWLKNGTEVELDDKVIPHYFRLDTDQNIFSFFILICLFQTYGLILYVSDVHYLLGNSLISFLPNTDFEMFNLLRNPPHCFLGLVNHCIDPTQLQQDVSLILATTIESPH